MLFQRLLPDDQAGFDLDTMRSADYDFGAPAQGCLALADISISGDVESKTVTLIEHWGQETSDPIQVIVVARPARLQEVGDLLIIRSTTETLLTDDEDVGGWINVGMGYVEPLFIMRPTLDSAFERMQAFLQPYINFRLSEKLN